MMVSVLIIMRSELYHKLTEKEKKNQCETDASGMLPKAIPYKKNAYTIW